MCDFGGNRLFGDISSRFCWFKHRCDIALTKVSVTKSATVCFGHNVLLLIIDFSENQSSRTGCGVDNCHFYLRIALLVYQKDEPVTDCISGNQSKFTGNSMTGMFLSMPLIEQIGFETYLNYKPTCQGEVFFCACSFTSDCVLICDRHALHEFWTFLALSDNPPPQSAVVTSIYFSW